MDRANLPAVIRGLNLLFLSGVLVIFAVISIPLSFTGALSFGFLGILAAFAAVIIPIVALSKLAKCHPKFRTAFFAAIATLVLGLLSNAILPGILPVLKDIASFFSTYMICIAVDELVQAFSAPQFPTGALVWKIQLLLAIGEVAYGFVKVSIPMMVIFTLLSLVAAAFYMMMLYKSGKALKAVTETLDIREEETKW